MAVGIAGVGRTPRQKARTRRNFDRMGNPAALIDPNSAIQLTSLGKLQLVIATGQPFTQTSAGLAFTVTASDLLSIASSALFFDDDLSRNESVFYGGVGIGELAI